MVVTGAPRKRLVGKPARGFESHPLRQTSAFAPVCRSGWASGAPRLSPLRARILAGFCQTSAFAPVCRSGWASGAPRLSPLRARILAGFCQTSAFAPVCRRRVGFRRSAALAAPGTNPCWFLPNFRIRSSAHRDRGTVVRGVVSRFGARAERGRGGRDGVPGRESRRLEGVRTGAPGTGRRRASASSASSASNVRGTPRVFATRRRACPPSSTMNTSAIAVAPRRRRGGRPDGDVAVGASEGELASRLSRLRHGRLGGVRRATGGVTISPRRREETDPRWSSRKKLRTF